MGITTLINPLIVVRGPLLVGPKRIIWQGACPQQTLLLVVLCKWKQGKDRSIGGRFFCFALKKYETTNYISRLFLPKTNFQALKLEHLPTDGGEENTLKHPSQRRKYAILSTLWRFHENLNPIRLRSVPSLPFLLMVKLATILHVVMPSD